MKRRVRLYGLMAEFDDPQRLLEAAKAARREGYRRMEAYTPFSIDEVSEELGHGRGWIPYIVFAGGVGGAILGLAMQWYAVSNLMGARKLQRSSSRRFRRTRNDRWGKG